MAELDLDLFAANVGARLLAEKLSLRQAAQKWPALNPAMLSRATNRQRLSAANFLVLCLVLKLDPLGFLIDAKRRRVTRKSLLLQAVTVSDKRETLSASRVVSPPAAAGAPAGPSDGLSACISAALPGEARKPDRASGQLARPAGAPSAREAET